MFLEIKGLAKTHLPFTAVGKTPNQCSQLVWTMQAHYQAQGSNSAK